MSTRTHRAEPGGAADGSTGLSTADGTAGASASSLAGLGVLIRLVLRRDRIRLPAWIAGHGLLVLYIGAALPQLAPQERDLSDLTVLLAQPVGRMFTGPAFGLDAPTYERFFAAGYTPYLFLLSALMSIFLVTRHTRGEEQSGRAELVRAGVTGRHTALTATLLVALLANLAAAVVVAALAMGVGYAATGSLLVGAATGMTGLVFAGIAAVTSQLSEFSRSAAGMAGALLGAAFVVRALGDMVAVGGSALSWASPLGWAAQTAPYVHDRWAPLGLSAGLVAVAVVLAFALQHRRDVGASFVATRPGRSRAHPWLGTPFGLAARLQRGGLLGWGTAILLLGVVDGAFTQAMVEAGDGMPDELAAVFGSDALVQGYTAFLGPFVVLMAGAYAVYAVQTLRSEEGSGRADTVLATPVGRTAWCLSHVGAIAIGILLIVTVTGLGTGIAAAAVTGDGDLVGGMLRSHLAALPAALSVLGLCTAVFGWLPRLTSTAGWIAVALMGVIQLFGSLLDLPEGFLDLSPLRHLAALPLEEFELVPYLVITGLAVLAAVIGLLGLRRRQMNVV